MKHHWPARARHLVCWGLLVCLSGASVGCKATISQRVEMRGRYLANERLESRTHENTDFGVELFHVRDWFARVTTRDTCEVRTVRRYHTTKVTVREAEGLGLEWATFTISVLLGAVLWVSAPGLSDVPEIDDEGEETPSDQEAAYNTAVLSWGLAVIVGISAVSKSLQARDTEEILTQAEFGPWLSKPCHPRPAANARLIVHPVSEPDEAIELVTDAAGVALLPVDKFLPTWLYMADEGAMALKIEVVASGDASMHALPPSLMQYLRALRRNHRVGIYAALREDLRVELALRRWDEAQRLLEACADYQDMEPRPCRDEALQLACLSVLELSVDDDFELGEREVVLERLAVEARAGASPQTIEACEAGLRRLRGARFRLKDR